MPGKPGSRPGRSECSTLVPATPPLPAFLTVPLFLSLRIPPQPGEHRQCAVFLWGHLLNGWGSSVSVTLPGVSQRLQRARPEVPSSLPVSCPRGGRALPGPGRPSCWLGLLPKPTFFEGLETRGSSQLRQDLDMGWPGAGVTMHLKLPRLKTACPPPFLHSSPRLDQLREPLRSG